jgi:hypothetical protein
LLAHQTCAQRLVIHVDLASKVCAAVYLLLLLSVVVVLLNLLKLVLGFLLAPHLNNCVLDNLALLMPQILRQSLVKAVVSFVILGPSHDRNAHCKRIKLQHLQGLELGSELFHRVLHLLEVGVVLGHTVHFVDLHDEHLLLNLAQVLTTLSFL